MELIKINKIMSKKAQFLHNTKKAKRQRLNAVYIKTKEKSSTPHYFVNDSLFILFDEAMKYCDNKNMSYNKIKKSYNY
jgi:hypothetical protein